MFYHQDAHDAVAMQEIEVIGMDDGEDNITTTSLSMPIVVWSPPMLELSATSVSSSSTSSSSSASSSSSGHSVATGPRHQDRYSNINHNKDDALNILLAMLSNESSFHTPAHRARLEAACRGFLYASLDDTTDHVNDHDRARMCDWYYEMADFLKIDRATASRSLALLDRFMATPIDSSVALSTRTIPSFASKENITVTEAVIAASKHRDVYQLVALTALFLSIKLFERLSIEPSHVSYLSRGRYTAQEVVKMESIMLQALEWKVCSAYKVDYVNAYLDVVLSKGDMNTTHHLLSSFKDLANVQIQLSDYDSSYSFLKPSLVAFAAVNNAFEMQRDGMSTIDQHIVRESIQGLMNKMYHHNRMERDELARTMERLRASVDPNVVGRSVEYSCCSGTPSIEPTRTTSTSYDRHRFSPSLQRDDNSSASADTQQQYVAVSPLDVALESIENFDVTQLLCCGGSTHQTDFSTHGNNGIVLEEQKKRRQHHAPRSVTVTDSPSPTSVIPTTRFGSRLL